MAERVIESNYENMISALNTSAKKIYDDAAQLLVYANTCAGALGESDAAVPEILQRITDAQQKYAECAAAAVDIANAMQEELDEIRREREVWNSDD